MQQLHDQLRSPANALAQKIVSNESSLQPKCFAIASATILWCSDFFLRSKAHPVETQKRHSLLWLTVRRWVHSLTKCPSLQVKAVLPLQWPSIELSKAERLRQSLQAQKLNIVQWSLASFIACCLEGCGWQHVYSANDWYQINMSTLPTSTLQMAHGSAIAKKGPEMPSLCCLERTWNEMMFSILLCVYHLVCMYKIYIVYMYI